jgi:hypothetical protein
LKSGDGDSEAGGWCELKKREIDAVGDVDEAKLVA